MISNDTKIIGIHGPLDGGKDTVANYIQSKLVDYNKYAFARPIKEACKIMFGFTHEQLEDRVLKEAIDPFWGFSPRRAMQLLGTEYGRDMLRKDIWIRRAEMEHIVNLKFNNKTIITDVRFENEATWLREQENMALIYIKVPNLEKDERYLHDSENGIIQMRSDLELINDKSLGLSNLYNKIDNLFTNE